MTVFVSERLPAILAILHGDDAPTVVDDLLGGLIREGDQSWTADLIRRRIGGLVRRIGKAGFRASEVIVMFLRRAIRERLGGLRTARVMVDLLFGTIRRLRFDEIACFVELTGPVQRAHGRR